MTTQHSNDQGFLDGQEPPTLEEFQAIQARENVGVIRGEVKRNIGDVQSREGRLATVTSLLVAKMLVDISFLGSDEASAADKAKLEVIKSMTGDPDIVDFANDKIESIKKGDLILPVSAKESGVRGAVDDSLLDGHRFVQILMTITG